MAATPPPKRPRERREPRAKPATAKPATRAAARPAAAAAQSSAPAEAPAASPRRRRVLLTGGAGFIGGAIARQLAERGEDLVALVRDARRAGALTELGVTVVEDDLSDVDRLTDELREVRPDAVIHAAGSYRIGIRRDERGAMWDANVGTTTRILDAAEAAGIPRIVYVSTVNVFGNTRGQVVDETYRRDLTEGFVSWYDETKYGAHEVVEQRIAGSAPIVIVLPSQVYGPGDHSGFGGLLSSFARGRLPVLPFPDLGLNMTFVDDIAAGIVLALDEGKPGRSYIMGGEMGRAASIFGTLARVLRRDPPRWHLPYRVLELAATVRPQLREVISSAKGVTFWATDDRARAELGYSPRSLADGFRETFTSGAQPATSDATHASAGTHEGRV